MVSSLEILSPKWSQAKKSSPFQMDNEGEEDEVKEEEFLKSPASTDPDFAEF